MKELGVASLAAQIKVVKFKGRESKAMTRDERHTLQVRMWAIVPSTINLLFSMNCTCIARRMAELPSLPHNISAQEILRSVANLPNEHVEEVFQEISRMPQIFSVVLDSMI